jgi:hypothetical protein
VAEKIFALGVMNLQLAARRRNLGLPLTRPPARSGHCSTNPATYGSIGPAMAMVIEAADAALVERERIVALLQMHGRRHQKPRHHPVWSCSGPPPAAMPDLRAMSTS